MTARYAIYFCPPEGSALEVLGRRWLGRDDDAGPVTDRIVPDGLDAGRLQSLTASPRLYGFHATLKPPFRLIPGAEPDDVREALARFAAGCAPVQAPPLQLAALDGFIALVPSAPAPDLHRFADDCVKAFDAFRAPPRDDETARRRAAGLSDRQEELLRRWGYPFVFEEFRYHMTLTGRIDDDVERAALQAALAPVVADACAAPLIVDAVSLCRQDGPGKPFVVDTRQPLRG